LRFASLNLPEAYHSYPTSFSPGRFSVYLFTCRQLTRCQTLSPSSRRLSFGGGVLFPYPLSTGRLHSATESHTALHLPSALSPSFRVYRRRTFKPITLQYQYRTVTVSRCASFGHGCLRPVIPDPTLIPAREGGELEAENDFVCDDAVQYLPSLTLTRPRSNHRNVDQSKHLLGFSLRRRRLPFKEINGLNLQRRFSSQTVSVDPGSKNLAWVSSPSSPLSYSANVTTHVRPHREPAMPPSSECYYAVSAQKIVIKKHRGIIRICMEESESSDIATSLGASNVLPSPPINPTWRSHVGGYRLSLIPSP
jgi:hypothetical protein